MEHQFHYGKKFYHDKKTGYWISTTYPRIRAHVWVWKFNNGKIEKGLHIHHIDGDKSNNCIDNLQCITAKEHIRKHINEERTKKNNIHIDLIRPLTKKWHASPKGIEWHRKNGIKTWEKRQSFWIMCIECYKSVETKTYHQQFCSGACKSKWRRRRGDDDIEKICPICNCKYEINKYAKTKTCSRKCGRIFSSQKH